MAFTAICAALLTAVASAGTNDIQRGERVMVLGDSITHLGYWTQYLQLFENLRHPDSGTRYYNAGVCGATVESGLVNFRAEVGRIRPNRVLCMFGMNDVHWCQYTNVTMSDEFKVRADEWLDQYRIGYGKLIDGILASGVKEIVLVTPSPYDEYSPEGVGDFRRKDVNEYGLRVAAEIVRTIAKERGLPVIDLHSVMTDACKRFPEKRLCGKDRVHPARLGNLFMALVCIREMKKVGSDAGVTLDAEGKVICSFGASVSNARAASDRYSFDYLPTALPVPDIPEYGELKGMFPEFQDFNRETLKIVGLHRGKWKLALHYGSAEFSASDLEKGINLAELQTTNRRLANAAAESMLALQVFDRLRRDSVACGRPSECAPLDAQEEMFFSALSVKPVVFHVDLRQEASLECR